MVKTLSNKKPQNALEFSNINISLGNKNILDNIDLSIAKGKTTVLLGPSGAGKTTLFKLGVGLLKPDAGKVIALGEKVHSLSSKALLKLRHSFGMLFQDGALFASMSVFDNIAFPLFHHLNLKGQDLKDRVTELLKLVDLTGTEKQMPESLSGGQKKRVGLARAIALNPKVVFFDEPTSGLDPIVSQQINHLIKDLQKKLHMTFFVITHDIKSALDIADYIGVLKKGRVHHFGNKSDLVNSDDKYIKEFIGNA